jgi:large subunit ribosomal protein L35Ae
VQSHLNSNLYKLNLLQTLMVTGKVVQFRRGRHTIHEKHMLIAVDGVDSKEDASKLVGKAVEWTSPAGKVIKGKVSAAHGNNGVVRAIFEKGLPGQAVATDVKIE